MSKTKREGKIASKKGGSPRISKKEARKFLSRVPEPNVFWCNDGSILRDINELKDALEMMSDQTFQYHSNDAKKDFSNWIRDVIGDGNLADSLETVPDRQNAARIVEERCSLLITKVG